VPTAQKAQVIAETRDDFERAQAAVLADYRGLTVHQMGALRKKLSERGVALKVIKNTLIKRAADEAGIEGLDPFLNGPTAVAFSYDDPVSAAKMMAEAVREFRRIEIKAGVLGKTAVDATGVRSLADLPSREVLIGRLAGTLNAPIQQLAFVLNAPIANLARALDQVRLKREAGPEVGSAVS
jgi:large subunit ribosomal protein L10